MVQPAGNDPNNERRHFKADEIPETESPAQTFNRLCDEIEQQSEAVFRKLDTLDASVIAVQHLKEDVEISATSARTTREAREKFARKYGSIKDGELLIKHDTQQIEHLKAFQKMLHGLVVQVDALVTKLAPESPAAAPFDIDFVALSTDNRESQELRAEKLRQAGRIMPSLEGLPATNGTETTPLPGAPYKWVQGSYPTGWQVGIPVDKPTLVYVLDPQNVDLFNAAKPFAYRAKFVADPETGAGTVFTWNGDQEKLCFVAYDAENPWDNEPSMGNFRDVFRCKGSLFSNQGFNVTNPPWGLSVTLSEASQLYVLTPQNFERFKAGMEFEPYRNWQAEGTTNFVLPEPGPYMLVVLSLYGDRSQRSPSFTYQEQRVQTQTPQFQFEENRRTEWLAEGATGSRATGINATGSRSTGSI